jgi:mannose-6-phosphate isomerase-like protein (cupin superfamily)
MIKTKDEMTKEVRQRMREGSGEVEIIHIFKKEEIKGKVRLFARIVLKKDCSIGFHKHEGEEEIFYIISGKAIVEDSGKTYTIGPGDATLTPGGEGHFIKNAGGEPLEFVAVILLYS